MNTAEVTECLGAVKRIDIGHYVFASVEWRCPKCNYSIERRSLYVSLGIRLGQEVEKCLRCGQWLSLGKREWRSLSAAARLAYFVSPGVLLLAAFFGFVIYIAWDSPSVTPPLFVGLTLIAVFWVFKLNRIRQSENRVRRQDRLP